MPTTALSQALKSKQKESKLSIAAMAKAIGANVQSVTAALKGKSVPNKTTAPKYAKFLKLSAAAFADLSKGAEKPAAKGKAAKKGGKGKTVKAAATKPTKAVKTVTLADAVELAADTLAVATFRATAKQRKVIAAVLNS